MSGTILVLGGRSEIGLAVARRLASGARVVLAARRADDLDEPERRLRNAGATAVHRVEFDADDLDGQRAVLDDVMTRFGPVATVVVAFGVLGDQARAEHDVDHALAVVHTDYVAHVAVLTHLAQLLRAQGSGTIVVFSSVAGVRVRRANYVYGSAKAGSRRVRVRAGRRARRQRGAAAAGPAGVRDRADDDGHDPRAVLAHRRTRWPTRRCAPCTAARPRCGCRRCCARCSR